jgi:hypothetical protein
MLGSNYRYTSAAEKCVKIRSSTIDMEGGKWRQPWTVGVLLVDGRARDSGASWCRGGMGGVALAGRML